MYEFIAEHGDIDKLNALEERLVDKGVLKPLSLGTTARRWDAYFKTIADTYVEQFGEPSCD